MKIAFATLACVLAGGLSVATRSGAQEHDHGPAETLGSVTFGNSCDAAVQPEFNRAVALMHSFQFGPAIAAFHSVLGKDPGCAIAYWGIAISDWGNPFAGSKSPTQIEAGLKAVEQGRTVGAKTERERAYLDSVAHLYVDSASIDLQTRLLAYESSMAAVSVAYPEDTEATIFYALALAAAADPTDKTYAKQLKAGDLLEKLFIKYPNHPGLAHYIIHAYDVPPLAARANGAAKRYGEIAPSTPHALHMPSHTFTRTGEWNASIDTNTRSAAAAKVAGQPADVLHASDYMVYGYLQTAQDDAAKRLVDSAATAFASIDPKAPMTGAAPLTAAYFAHAAIPARYCLERRAWGEAAKLEPLPTPFPFTDAITYFARGLGAAHLKDATTARGAIDSLATARDKLTQMKEVYWAGQVEIQRQEVVAMLAYAEGHADAGVAGMRAAAALEDKAELSSVTPGPITPAREMLAEMLLETKRPSDALKEFEASLTKEPNRFWSLYGAAKAAKLAGDSQASRLYFEKLVKMAERGETPGRQELAEARDSVRRK